MAQLMPLEQVLGAALILLFLGDIFLTVLYARAGTGLLAPHWSRAVWGSIGVVAWLFPGRRGAVLSFAGPLIVVSLIAFWALGLTVGAALIIHPGLGGAIRPSSGDTSTDFITALLVAGNSLSIVGGGDYAPHTTGTRLIFLINSLIGTSVVSLVLSYLVQVYSALRERNALALTIDLMTGSTGDAAQMLVWLGLNGDGGDVTNHLSNLTQSLSAAKEGHHFYPLLFYFRFDNPVYSVSRFSFVLLDLVTLIATALDEQRYGSLIRSGPVASLRQCTLLLIGTLDENLPTVSSPTDVTQTRHHRQSYAAAIETLGRAGVVTRADGVDRYVAERQQWEPLINRVGPTLGFRMDEIDQRRLQDKATRPHS